MEDEEDLKRMIALINTTKEMMKEDAPDYHYDDFIICENSDGDENGDYAYIEDNFEFCNFKSSTDLSKLNSYESRSSLKPDELQVIDSCSDSDLRKLLLLNRTKNFQLMQMYKKLKDLLIQCQKDIVDKNELLTNFMKQNVGKQPSSGAWRLAAPYFKDKQLYSCPPNADAVRKKKNNELCVYDITYIPRWTNLECEKLQRAVKLNYNINQQNEVMKKMKNLETNDNEMKALQARMEELQKEDNCVTPPLNSDQFIDWMRVAEVFLQDRRTSFECTSFWHIYLHPSINKTPWTPEEIEKLKKLAVKHRLQNWDDIARELGSNRTGFMACMKYHTNLHERVRKGDFTHAEDMMITQLVQKHKMGDYIPWFKIAQHFKDRTRSQLHHRYTYYLSQTGKRKGKFTDEEDILLMILVDRFGRNYKKCSEYLPTRSLDDEIIMKYVEERGEKSWSQLTKVLRRCRNQIRQRYHTIKAYMEKNPASTLATVPRRKHKLQAEEDAFNFLRMIADQFRDSEEIPTLQEIGKALRQQGYESNQPLELPNAFEVKFPNKFNVDEMLTNFFSDSFKMTSSKCITPHYVQKAVTDVRTVLDVLQVKLDIPEDFEHDNRLDNLDVAVLNALSTEREGNEDVNNLLAPNLNTVLGLRNLLIKFSSNNLEYQETNKDHVNEAWSNIVRQLLNLSDRERDVIEKHYHLFFKRFQTLFKWPAVMTLVNPSAELHSTCNNELTVNKIQVKRTYSKADKNETIAEEVPGKRMKNSEAASSSTAITFQPLKLTPVTNKSVIEDLLRNRDKKLFCLEAVQGEKGTTTVIKEVDFHSYVDKQVESTANVEVASTPTKNRATHFIPGQGECIILRGDDDALSGISDESLDDDGVEEDDVDIVKLEQIIHDQVGEVSHEVLEDFEDLKKLDDFIKTHKGLDMDFA
ncbi:hypothetical protein NQ315_001160 [Exocentrus adspersus]|uniref:snRNA-activating protein complex subunit 4 n=1 Tax=Exocentrus adspersus TaxID=1586481 RepID=A0AAV8WFY0_9CUCU|nr:hypothetical protein NQ315_001160 [Exocentrus adspersus]